MEAVMIATLATVLRPPTSVFWNLSFIAVSRRCFAFSLDFSTSRRSVGKRSVTRKQFAAKRRNGRAEQDRGEEQSEPVGSLPFASEYHTPVMVNEVVDTLVHDPCGVYVDCTLGGGGHSEAILERLASLGAGGRLLAVDRDPEALASARARLAGHLEEGRFATAQSDFRHLRAVLKADGVLAPNVPQDWLGVHGILLDLGVSSHQIDQGRRGFSFKADGPLDMRMECDVMEYGVGPTEDEGKPFSSAPPEGKHSDDFAQTRGGSSGAFPPATVSGMPVVATCCSGAGHSSQQTGLTAAVVVNEWPVEELRRVLQDYGEEPRAHKMALRLSENRPINTTAQLVDVVRSCLPPGPPKDKRKALSRVFQGLRIAVNDELGALEAVLRDAAELVRPGGRVVVLSYHSLEDRRVKRVLRSGSLDGVVKQDMRGNVLSPWRPLRKVPKEPSRQEVSRNPRARSAKLRAAERTDMPAPAPLEK